MRSLIPLIAFAALLWTGGCAPRNISEPSGSTLELRRGAVFVIPLEPSPAVSPEYAYWWETPKVTGEAVVYEGIVENRRGQIPPPGSAEAARYRFKTIRSGEATIVIPIKAGPQAREKEDYILHVRVK